MNIRHQLFPGDIGYLTRLHGILYYQEYGYDNTFEAYVARGLAGFVKTEEKSHVIWGAERTEERYDLDFRQIEHG